MGRIMLAVGALGVVLGGCARSRSAETTTSDAVSEDSTSTSQYLPDRPEADPPLPEFTVDEFGAPVDPAAFHQAVLADGLVRFAEYQWAVAYTGLCLRGLGVPVESPLLGVDTDDYQLGYYTPTRDARRFYHFDNTLGGSGWPSNWLQSYEYCIEAYLGPTAGKYEEQGGFIVHREEWWFYNLALCMIEAGHDVYEGLRPMSMYDQALAAQRDCIHSPEIMELLEPQP